MLKELLNKIDKNSKIALYGAGTTALFIKNHIEEKRKDVKIEFFIDSNKTGNFEELKIVNILELENHKNEIDCAIITIRPKNYEIYALLGYLGIKAVVITENFEKYIRTLNFNDKQKAISQIFKTKESKDLYNLLWDYRTGQKEINEIKEYVLKQHSISRNTLARNYLKQYLEYINKNTIKTIYDGGFYNGINSLIFKKELPNLQKIYAFEPMYDKFKNKVFEHFINKDSIAEIIPLGLYNNECELEFYEDNLNNEASRIIDNNQNPKNHKPTTKIKTTTIDKIRQKENSKIDLIKMDIEGSELYALQGAINSITKDRPQLAISIYHSTKDFIEIPNYLNSKLKNYNFYLGHYMPSSCDTVLYAIPCEIDKNA